MKTYFISVDDVELINISAVIGIFGNTEYLHSNNPKLLNGGNFEWPVAGHRDFVPSSKLHKATVVLNTDILALDIVGFRLGGLGGGRLPREPR